MPTASSNSRNLSIVPIRTPAQWAVVREICCKTANSGAPIDFERWPFFGDFWVGPYERLAPEWTWVALDGERVIGYLTGCPDTTDFERRKWLRFTLPLLLNVTLGRYTRNGDTRRFLRRTLGLEKGPNEFFSEEARRRLTREFPAHLHTNIESDYRGSGIGQLLSEAYFEKLSQAGVSGVHLFCGQAPLRFYERIGFEEIARHEFRPGVWVYLLGRGICRHSPV